MKNRLPYYIVIMVLLLVGADLSAQYGRGYGGGGYGYGGGGYGRQRSTIPQAQSAPEPPEPKTADQIVDGEMPGITEALDLNPFEEAVLSSTLKKYLKKRIEMQILELSPDQMREGMERITKNQTAELEAGLPPEKYEAFVEMQKKGIDRTKKKKKKERKRKAKKKDKS